MWYVLGMAIYVQFSSNKVGSYTYFQHMLLFPTTPFVIAEENEEKQNK